MELYVHAGRSGGFLEFIVKSVKFQNGVYKCVHPDCFFVLKYYTVLRPSRRTIHGCLYLLQPLILLQSLLEV